MQVGPRMPLLADCGRSASSCCRHVDISTVVHRGHRPSTTCPLSTPWSVPRSYPGRIGPRTTVPGAVTIDSCGGPPQAVEAQVSGSAAAWLRCHAACGGRCGKSGQSPLVTWHTRDLPNLCTFLGTTHRSVDDGHPPGTDRYPVASGLLPGRHIHTAVDRARRPGKRGAGGCPDRGRGDALQDAPTSGGGR